MYVLFLCLGEGESSSELKPIELNSIARKCLDQLLIVILLLTLNN